MSLTPKAAASRVWDGVCRLAFLAIGMLGFVGFLAWFAVPLFMSGRGEPEYVAAEDITPPEMTWAYVDDLDNPGQVEVHFSEPIRKVEIVVHALQAGGTRRPVAGTVGVWDEIEMVAESTRATGQPELPVDVWQLYSVNYRAAEDRAGNTGSPGHFDFRMVVVDGVPDVMVYGRSQHAALEQRIRDMEMEGDPGPPY